MLFQEVNPKLKTSVVSITSIKTSGLYEYAACFKGKRSSEPNESQNKCSVEFKCVRQIQPSLYFTSNGFMTNVQVDRDG